MREGQKGGEREWEREGERFRAREGGRKREERERGLTHDPLGRSNINILVTAFPEFIILMFESRLSFDSLFFQKVCDGTSPARCGLYRVIFTSILINNIKSSLRFRGYINETLGSYFIGIDEVF